MGARLDASRGAGTAALRGGVLSGLLPGAGLGLAAGAFIVATRLAQGLVEERIELERDESRRDHREDPDREEAKIEDGPSRDERDAIPEDIRRMSNEELRKSIEDLKRGIDGRSPPGSETAQSNGAEEKSSEPEGIAGSTSLLHKLGFRPHPS